MQCKCGTNFDVEMKNGRAVYSTTGHFVMGSRCPACNTEYNRQCYLKRRERTKRNERRSDPVLALSHRKCQSCGVQLHIDRYFNCVACLPRNQSVDDYTIYYGETSEDLGEELN